MVLRPEIHTWIKRVSRYSMLERLSLLMKQCNMGDGVLTLVLAAVNCDCQDAVSIHAYLQVSCGGVTDWKCFGQVQPRASRARGASSGSWFIIMVWCSNYIKNYKNVCWTPSWISQLADPPKPAGCRLINTLLPFLVTQKKIIFSNLKCQ